MRISDWSSDVCSSDLPGRYSLTTVHRAETTDAAASLRAVIGHLEKVAAERTVVLPLHPRTAQASIRFGVSLKALKVIEPVGYLDMTALLDGCIDVHTDSGGVQKEAYFHGKPCVTLRGETEWVETVEEIGRASCRERGCQYV